jgi:DNA-binding GntR family transcriptional regulator
MQPIQTSSVVTLAYERIRALILSGDVAPGTRLGQVDLADQLGVSRTPVREALRRLAGEGLVDFEDQRGFRVAALHIHDVVRRLEVRLLLEPPTARLAAERRTDAELAALAATVVAEEHATTALAAHDASRAFHIAIAAATQNPELVMTLENLWLIEVGRRLLARRTTEADWQRADAAEHRTLLAAIDARDGERAANLMAEHVRGALRHWEPEQAHEIP